MSDLTNFINILIENVNNNNLYHKKIKTNEDINFNILKEGVISFIKKINDKSDISMNLIYETSKNGYNSKYFPIIDLYSSNKNKDNMNTNIAYFDNSKECIKMENRLNKHFKEEEEFKKKI